MPAWHQVYEAFRLAGIVIGAVGAFTFVIYYGFTAPWYKTDTGRFLMMSGVGWASLYAAGMIAAFIPKQIVTETLRIVLIVFAAIFVWRQVFLYRKFKKGGMKDD